MTDWIQKIKEANTIESLNLIAYLLAINEILTREQRKDIAKILIDKKQKYDRYKTN